MSKFRITTANSCEWVTGKDLKETISEKLKISSGEIVVDDSNCQCLFSVEYIPIHSAIMENTNWLCQQTFRPRLRDWRRVEVVNSEAKAITEPGAFNRDTYEGDQALIRLGELIDTLSHSSYEEFSSKITYKLENIRNRLLTGYGEVITYSSWSRDYKLQHLWDKVDFLSREYSISEEELRSLSIRQLVSYGFVKWNKEENLYLIPIYLHHYLPYDMVVTSISGDRSTLGECDKDHRWGSLAYGIVVKE